MNPFCRALLLVLGLANLAMHGHHMVQAHGEKHDPMPRTRYSEFKRKCVGAVANTYECYRFSVVTNATLTLINEGASVGVPSADGNIYRGYGDVWTDTTERKWIGRYLTLFTIMGPSKDLQTGGSVPTVSARLETTFELGTDHSNHMADMYNDAIMMSGTWDLSLSGLPSPSGDTTVTIHEADIAVTGGIGFFRGAEGEQMYQKNQACIITVLPGPWTAYAFESKNTVEVFVPKSKLAMA